MDRLTRIGIYLVMIPLCCLELCQIMEMLWRGIAHIGWGTPPGNLVMAARIVTVIAAPIGIALLIVSACLQLLA